MSRLTLGFARPSELFRFCRSDVNRIQKLPSNFARILSFFTRDLVKAVVLNVRAVIPEVSDLVRAILKVLGNKAFTVKEINQRVQF